MHSRAFRRFSAASLVFLFLGFFTLQLNQTLRILCDMYGEEGVGGGGTLIVCLQKLYLNDVSECPPKQETRKSRFS